jgi:7-carboxy-7-deazaguanine synthase
MADGIGGRLFGTCSGDRGRRLPETPKQRAAKPEVRRSDRVGAGIHGFAMVITEIFKSIQGEGTRAGLPCIFVRLTGCNLRCTWCDTAYAFHGGTKHSIEEVLEQVQALAGDEERRVALVEITGGEPLLQGETPTLAEKLIGAGYTVMIETSGEQFVGALPHGVIKIVDVKCPDSGEADTFNMANLEAVGAKDEIKFVISTRRDYDFARDFVKTHRLAERVHEILFSPVFEDPGGKWAALTARELAEWILEDGLRVRLGLQLHKFIWDPAMKGV